MSILYIILIAISLSMDAFSLSLSIGTLFYQEKNRLMLSIIVGVFHFFMPLIGSILGLTFVKSFNINSNLLSGIIFLYIAIGMFKEFKSDDKKEILINLVNMFIFAFGVSLDSFGVGFTFNNQVYTNIIYSLIFALSAFSFTYIGLKLGNKLEEKIGSYAILFGTILMTFLGIINLINI